MQNTITTSRNPQQQSARRAVVHADCRRAEAQRDLAAALAALDDGYCTQQRVLNHVSDRLLATLASGR